MTLDNRFENWQPITEDDETIRAALAEANIPALVPALVHLTGDPSILDGEIRPDASSFVDLQCGVTEEAQAKARALAFEALRAYRDGGCRLPPPPTTETVRRMMDWMIGVPLPEGYVDFLERELSLDGRDPYEVAGLDEIPEEARRAFHVVVIGAGMSGILAAGKLEAAGISYTVIEKNADVGGTWLENTYPGCRVDSPNHSYSYSFAPNDWPQFYSARKVLREYFQRCADELGVRHRIRFETEVEGADFDESTLRWTVHLRKADGSREDLEANAVISAVGQLNRPRLPDIEGRDSFAGPAFHSARWEHQHDLRGKRIAVIGTGASAFQLVPEIAREAAEVRVFQRTPPWIRPTEDYHRDVPAGKHWLLQKVPYYAKWYRFLMFWLTAEGMLAASQGDPEWPDQERSVSQANEELRQLLVENVKMYVGDDPELFEKTVPRYPPAGKRMLFDNGTWLTTLKQEHVHLVTEPITRITEKGVATADGTEHEADVLVFATGFQAQRLLWPMKIRGRGGVELREAWQDDDPRAYLGITVPGFPNLFCLYGPNTNIVVNGSIIFFSECEVRYVLGCLELLLESGHAAMDCRREVHDAYNVRIDEGNRQMAWGVPGVRSWYKNSKGRVTQNWPFTLVEFWQQTRAPEASDYELLRAPELSPAVGEERQAREA
jgi:4-hydroxyacetophenone monooxygenase